MQNREIKNLPVSEGITYVSGLGFIAPNNTQKITRDIRRLSTTICFCLILFFACQRFFVLPATYFAYFLGFDININRYTGMILTTDFSNQMITFFVNTAAMLTTMLLCSLFCLKQFKLQYAFRKPHPGSLPIFVPIIVAVGLLGQTLGTFFAKICHLFGIVFSRQMIFSPGDMLLPNITSILMLLSFIALEEILFRGIILYSLRRYGDGFAIFVSSLLFAIFQDGVIEMVSTFFLGLALGYFVVRSGSVYTAIIGHGCLYLFLFGIAFAQKQIDPALAGVIIILSCILVCVISAFSFITFVIRDKNAFVLKKPDGNLSLRRRLITFCATFAFLIFAFMIFMHIINRIQIIG